MKGYINLINALQTFEEDWLFDLGIEGCKSSLIRQRDSDKLDFCSLKEEYFKCLSDNNVNWKELAVRAGLFSSVEIYTNWEIKTIVEYYLEDFILPESSFTNEISKNVASIIKAVLLEKNDWVGVKELLSMVNNYYPSIKTYHLFNYKEYFELDLEVKKESRDRLWIIDSFRLVGSK